MTKSDWTKTHSSKHHINHFFFETITCLRNRRTKHCIQQMWRTRQKRWKNIKIVLNSEKSFHKKSIIWLCADLSAFFFTFFAAVSLQASQTPLSIINLRFLQRRSTFYGLAPVLSLQNVLPHNFSSCNATIRLWCSVFAKPNYDPSTGSAFIEPSSSIAHALPRNEIQTTGLIQ